MKSLYVQEGGKGLRDVQTLSSTKTTIASSRNGKERLLSTFTVELVGQSSSCPVGFLCSVRLLFVGSFEHQ